MQSYKHLPNGRILLEGMGLTLERLQAGSKAAVSLPIIKALLCVAASGLPFDADFYVNSYPDIRAAFESGEIKDLRTHFIEVGYLEGRLGASPEFDEEFYTTAYPDVATALAKENIRSAREHYIYDGTFEGRSPTGAVLETANQWLALLRPS